MEEPKEKNDNNSFNLLIQRFFPSLNENQKNAISETEGPVQIIAGPGSGKTLILVLRTLYLLFTDKALPKEIFLTTFTEKAAFELRDRLHQIAQQFNYQGPLYELTIGTIHGLCNQFINQNRHHTELKKNFEILDELTQKLFIYEHFKDVIGISKDEKYLNKWKYKWTAIKGIIPYLNKITEELIDPNVQTKNSTPFIKDLFECYKRYKKKLIDENRLDFAHQQKIFYELLFNNQISEKIKKNIKYIMIDEYQDTNFVQEQIILKLGSSNNNICIVGDEDQALYRFRGATVRNILEFQTHFSNVKQIPLSINYRSHKLIIDAYNKFMNSIDWENNKGNINFRFKKIIIPNPKITFPDYPAVFSIWGINEADEAKRFALMTKFLKEHNIIQDYNQIALLLHSVRPKYSEKFIRALDEFNIPSFAPRAKGFFENDEIKLMVGCYAIIFGFYGSNLIELGGGFIDFINFTQDSIAFLGPFSQTNLELPRFIKDKVNEIESLKEGETLDLSIIDYFYNLIAYKPFSNFLKNENRAHNLSIFSHLLSVFQEYYNIHIITYKNRDWIRKYLFTSFIKFLFDGGIDEFEDPDNPIPSGYVQIMTIHQSKGLEFPVIVVGSLDKAIKVSKIIDKDLSQYYHRPKFEPENRITEFDRMRLFYVAFSRAEKILVLTSTNKPKDFFSSIWDGLDQWPYVETKVLESLYFNPKPQFVPKKSYSLTSQINTYELCPQQYLFYHEYNFTPSRTASMLFGTLVHQTIEEIHKWTLEGRLSEIDQHKINEFFEANYRSLIAIGLRPLSRPMKKRALDHVFNYFNENNKELQRVIDTELDVSVEKANYILTGKIDLLMGSDGKLELLDFKTFSKPNIKDSIFDQFFKQLCTYAYILKLRYRKNPERLLLYWTSEKKRSDALMEFKFTEQDIENAGIYFDNIVSEIQKKQFSVKKAPESKVCNECDFRMYCANEAIIKLKK